MNVPMFFLPAPAKFCYCFWISIQRPNGGLKSLIAKAGIAWAIALMSTSFLPLEKNLLFQLKILFKTLSWISFKKLLFFLPTLEGSPTYFSCLDTTWSLKMFFYSGNLICMNLSTKKHWIYIIIENFFGCCSIIIKKWLLSWCNL